MVPDLKELEQHTQVKDFHAMYKLNLKIWMGVGVGVMADGGGARRAEERTRWDNPSWTKCNQRPIWKAMDVS